MKNYVVTVRDARTGETVYECAGRCIIAGASDGAGAEVFLPVQTPDAECAALIDAAERAFSSVGTAES